MSRRGARRNAFYLLFQMDFSEAEEFEQVKELFFAEKEEPVEEEDKEFILSEVEGVHAHMAEIDEMITASANGWDPARMNKVDLAILRLAVYEMKYGETPIGVASMRRWSLQNASAPMKHLPLSTAYWAK